jgi:hypothetical protein
MNTRFRLKIRASVGATALLFAAAGCTIPVPNPSPSVRTAEVVNNTAYEVRVKLQRIGNGNEVFQEDLLDPNTATSGNVMPVPSDALGVGVCVTPIFEPASTPNGMFYAPDPTWCNDSDDKVEQWVIELKPNPSSLSSTSSTTVPVATSLG